MRSTIAVLGLAAVATAAKTVTEVVDVTVTSCAPTVTGCPNGGDWGSWPATTTPSKPIKETSTWADWDPSKPKTTTAASSSWADWDPSKPKTTPKAETSTWADWDPTKPKTTTAASSSWADWDPSKPKTTPKAETSTWADWDPTKPKTTTKASSWEEWNGSGKPSSVKPATGTETWAAWESAKPSSVKPASGSQTWAAWESGKPSSTVNCPKYTETAAPTWLAALPSDVKSSLASKWASTVPADWCYYSYSAIPQTVSTATGKGPAAATATGTGSWAAWTPDATSKGPIATYTGAASKNAVAGLAGVAGLAALLL